MAPVAVEPGKAVGAAPVAVDLGTYSFPMTRVRLLMRDKGATIRSNTETVFLVNKVHMSVVENMASFSARITAPIEGLILGLSAQCFSWRQRRGTQEPGEVDAAQPDGPQHGASPTATVFHVSNEVDVDNPHVTYLCCNSGTGSLMVGFSAKMIKNLVHDLDNKLTVIESSHERHRGCTASATIEMLAYFHVPS